MQSFTFIALLCFWGTTASSQESLSFLVLGDWGGDDNTSPTTAGETCTASGMGKVAKDLNAQFVLALGDNFYDSGITASNTNRFNSTFESVFTSKSLDIDWWVVAGNHDHRGTVQKQIDYSKQSSRWKFPSESYTFSKTFSSGKVADFVMFDSVVIAGMSYHDETTDTFVEAVGPVNETAASTTWAWLEEQLAASKAEYLFVAAHYPVWSACSHGPTKSLVSQLRPLLRKYDVTAYLSGHDHCLEHLVDEYSTYVLSGAGAQAWYKLDQKDALPSGVSLPWHLARDNAGHLKGGFASISLSDQAATIKYFGDDGNLLYTADQISPRKIAKPAFAI
jgi:tartrate-resistant acid phosphatase type 5